MTNKLKVIVIASNLKIAGAQKMIEQLVLNIDKSNFIVRLLVISERKDTVIERNLKKANIDVVYLGKANGFHLSFFSKVSNAIKTFQPDVIHTHVNSWLYAIPYVISHPVKLIHTIHSSPERQESNAILRMIIKSLYKSGKAVPIAISDKIRNDAVSVYNLSIDKIERIYNPVDYLAFSQKSKEKHDSFTFVNVARFNRIKNHKLLIEAFAVVSKSNPNIKLVLAGDGELRSETIELVNTLGLNNKIDFVGNVDDVSNLLSKCDVFVLPSKSEGMPISLLEAESAGLPVIASNVGGIPDVFDENGFLVKVDDLDSLVSAMIQIMSDAEELIKMGKRSQSIAKRYSSDVIAREYEALYKKYGKNK